MIELTGEKVPQSLLAKAESGKKYFDNHGEYLRSLRFTFSLSYVGNLLRIEQLVPVEDVSNLADYDIYPASVYSGMLTLGP